jgi:hypothetical protein
MHVYTNTGDASISILPGARVRDGAVEYIMRRVDDGATYSAGVLGEVGVYNFSDLNLRLTDQLKPGIQELRWLAQAWRDTPAGDRQVMVAAAQLPGAFEGLVMRLAAPEAAQGWADMLGPVVAAGVEGFDRVNAQNVMDGIYSPRTQAELREMAPLVLSAVGGVLATIGMAQGGMRVASNRLGTIGGNLTRRAVAQAVRSAEGEGFDLILRYNPSWSAAQRAAAAAKVQLLNEADTIVTRGTRGANSASRVWNRAGRTRPPNSDIDHMHDLQLGGSDTIGNMLPLNSSVNRSLGSQIGNVIRTMPDGTRINRVIIE